jgi:hypothetical protein
MDFEDVAKPSLIEPGVKYFLNETLKQCHVIRNNFHNMIFNVGMLIAFIIIIAIILLYKYKGRISSADLAKKNLEKQQYILSKIKNFQEAKRIAHQELITGLPQWENEYENLYTR